MSRRDLEDRLKRAERAVSFADQDARHALRVLGDGARPRIAQIGMTAAALGVVGALIVRKGRRSAGRRSASRLSRAIDYSVLVPLAASLIPRIVSALSSRRANAAYESPAVDATLRDPIKSPLKP